MASTTYGSASGPEVPQKTFVEDAAPYVCECVGTYLLVFTICACSAAGDAIWNPTAIAAMLMVLVYIFGPVSGAHLNPAVSLACGIAKKTPWAKVAAYCLLQISGGLLAGVAAFAVFNKPLGVSPVSPYSFEHAALVEGLYTMMLCFVVLNVATARSNNPDGDQNHFFGLAIGFVIIAGGYASGDVSGGVFNPAAAMGLEVVGSKNSSSQVPGGPYGLSYAMAELLGAVAGGFFFRFCRRDDATNDSDPGFEPPLYSRFFSEFLGTFMLSITVGLSLVTKTAAVPWAAAAALTSMVYALHDVSGAHLNPAVTFAVVLAGRGKCSVSRGLAFWACQLSAGLLAGLLCSFMHLAGPNKHEDFLLQPKNRHSWVTVLAAELAFTFMLAFVVLSVATSKQPESYSTQNFHFGFAIGACVMAGGFAVGTISGGVFNPAVSWSLAACGVAGSSLQQLRYCAAYSLFQLTGGILAASVYAVTHRSEYKHLGVILD